MKQRSLRTRLFASVGLILLAAAATSLYSVYTIHSLRTRLRDEIEVSSTRLDQSRQITIGLAGMRGATRGITLFSLTKNYAGAAKARANFAASAAKMREVIEQLERGRSTEGEAATINAIRSGLDQWVQNFAEFSDLCAAGRIEEADRATVKNTSPIMDAIQKNATALGDMNRALHDAAVKELEASAERNSLVSMMLAL